METKNIKLSNKKDGYGNISSYTINIGANEAKECGFINKEGNKLELEKVLDYDNKQIIIKIKE